MTSSKHLADEIYNMALSLNRIAAISYGTPQTFTTGSPEALADCRARLATAITNAQNLPTQDEDIEDRLDSRIPDLPREYDTDTDSGDENDEWGPV